MGNPVGWFEIYVQDLPRAQRFYEAVLGVTLTPLENPGIEMLAFPMDQAGYGSSGALVHMAGYPSGGNSVLVYFHSNDCSEEGRVAACGGQLVRPKASIGPYGFISLLLDTEGNMFGLHSMA